MSKFSSFNVTACVAVALVTKSYPYRRHPSRFAVAAAAVVEPAAAVGPAAAVVLGPAAPGEAVADARVVEVVEPAAVVVAPVVPAELAAVE